ncbi:MAG: YraN family protein [Chloroflexi bacterium]|nr:YraN family protein [Chloroflexota bacterium]
MARGRSSTTKSERANTKRTGQVGEDLACAALTRRGYEIVARNWRCPQGELDIVARDGACWVFVEVKARRGRGAGLPEEGLTADKLARLSELAEIYLAERAVGETDWRIDLVAIELGRDDRVRRLTVLPALAPD